MTEHDTETASFSFDGVNWALRGWPGIEGFINELEEFWRPFEDSRVPDQANVIGHIAGSLHRLREWVGQAKARNETPGEFGGTLSNALHQAWGPYHPDGVNGRIVHDIRESLGKEAAIYAYALMRNALSVSQIASVNQLRGALAVAFPHIAGTAGAETRLAAERANFRAATRRLADEVALAEAQRAARWDALLDRASGKFVKAVRRRSRAWRSALERWRGDNAAAIATLEATDRAYKELMRLKAPATYWSDKAAEHGKAEKTAACRVRWFFIIAVPAMALMFGLTAATLLSYAGSTPPAGLYVIAGAGLATTAGLLFWVGRLLTKLYLSQHHLRQDAEERAVMTTTYLALTADAAAGDTDRQIILSALFRATSDGIVKEEGGLDASLPALISRLATR